MNENNLFYDFDEKIPLAERIKAERSRLNEKQQKAYITAYKEEKLFKQYRVKA